MAVSEERDIAFGLHHPVDHIVRAGGYLTDSFAAFHTVAENVPAGMLNA